MSFDKFNSKSRMRINSNGVDLGGSWTLSAWVKNVIPPVYSGLSTLYRGQDRQSNREYDRYLVVRGTNQSIHSYDGADGNWNNRYRNADYVLDSAKLEGWHLFYGGREWFEDLFLH